MKIITSTHYNRPQCTSRMIDHLSRCVGIEGYKVLFFVEPGCDEVVSRIDSCDLNKEVHVNSHLLGCWTNKKRALIEGFDRSDYVIHVEDDILLGKDALQFFEWAGEVYRDNDSVFSVTAYNRIPKEQFFNTRCQHCGHPTSYYEIERRKQYTPWAWATWKSRWDEFNEEWNGQDMQLGLFYRNNRFEVFPTLSRCQNIGYESGVVGSTELLECIIKLRYTPRGPEFIKAADELRAKVKDGDIIQNVLGQEWIKLDDNNIKSRSDLSEYMEKHRLDLWSEDVDLPPFTGFFDLGHARTTAYDEYKGS